MMMKGNLLFLVFLTMALILTSCQKSALEELESTIARQQIVASQKSNVDELGLKKDVPLQGFYKDVFMDAGVSLTTRNTLAAASYLGFSLESVSCSEIADSAWQNTIIAGDATDTNGRLLYPDGQPRYRMIFVCGGKATSHSNSLRPSCLERMRDFVHHGGSYVGTCAGFFFATEGYDCYLGLWPAKMNRTGLKGIYTGMFVDEDSYAVDGVGQTTVKGLLNNGESWVMDKKTEDGDPSHTMIGDMQYHHFVVNVPSDVKDITISLTSSADCDLQLLACSDTYAYADIAEYKSESKGANQQIVIPYPQAGLWYIAVRCLTTVTSTDVPLGQEYTGRTDVLNGVPYNITASWTVQQDAAIKDIYY